MISLDKNYLIPLFHPSRSTKEKTPKNNLSEAELYALKSLSQNRGLVIQKNRQRQYCSHY